MNNYFDVWQNGVPVLSFSNTNDFSTWDNGVPFVSPVTNPLQFGGTGVAEASAALSTTTQIKGSGTGISEGQSSISATKNATASGTGISLGSAILTGLVTVTLRGSGTGVSIASARIRNRTGTNVGNYRKVDPTIPQLRTVNFANMFPYRKACSKNWHVRHLGD